MTNMACWIPSTRGLWGHTHLTGLWHWWLNSRSKADTSTFKQCILYISKWEIRKRHDHKIRKMVGSEDSCGKLEAGRRFAGFISLASWAVATGTVRCEVLVHGSYSGPIPDSAERRGSSIQIQTSDGFSGPAWLCPWATWHACNRNMGMWVRTVSELSVCQTLTYILRAECGTRAMILALGDMAAWPGVSGYPALQRICENK